MLTNCLAVCAHLTITVSEIQRDICEKIVILSYPLHSTPPLGGLSSEYRHPLWYGKTRMVSLPDGEKISKISLFVLAQLRNVTDRQTDERTDGHRVTAKIALMHMHRAVKTALRNLSYKLLTYTQAGLTESAQLNAFPSVKRYDGTAQAVICPFTAQLACNVAL